MEEQQNRRESFRLDDSMRLQVTALDPKALDDILQDFDGYRIQSCLTSSFYVQRELHQPSLQLIRNSDPAVAQYLEHLEGQMLLLAERMSGGDESSLRIQPEVSVNISSHGLRYYSNEVFSLGQTVEVAMQLSTNGAHIIALATVVRMEEGKDEYAGQKEYSLNFSHIHTDDSESFTRHMVKLQGLQLQAKRAG